MALRPFLSHSPLELSLTSLPSKLVQLTSDYGDHLYRTVAYPSAGGKSLIKLAFRWTRKLNGGPAHAAIVSSALFGTISGGPVVNVLATGILTIPMMIKRGFSKIFAGGVEAAASSGGQIMPPIMGVAAFILAALTQVPYREVIIAALIPAIAYFGCLFLSAVFQARKQNIKAIGVITDDMV